MSPVSVSIREFAKIVGVNHSVVVRSIQRGGRLEQSVISEGDTKKIFVYAGCVEWHLNKDLRKDQSSNSFEDESIDQEEMSVADAVRKQRHYDALLSELEFLKEAGKLYSIEKARVEMSTIARATRDNFLYLPVECESEIKRLVFNLIRKEFGEAECARLSSKVDEAALGFRIFLKTAIRKILYTLSNDLEKDSSIFEKPVSDVSVGLSAAKED
ncbi:MAG: hypothetical protein EOP04_21610 [Proteobacteria bacterium]|nr:MAG: hypothetical protein EOP04_21610 [Pseudomonadota bacterium]